MIRHQLFLTRVLLIGPRYRIICIITQEILAPLHCSPLRPGHLLSLVKKTARFREQQLQIPVMRLTQDHPLYSMQAYECHISLFLATPSLPAFLRFRTGHASPIAATLVLSPPAAALLLSGKQ